MPLYLMLDFARRRGQQLASGFAGLSGEFAVYQVPALRGLRDSFLGQARSKEGAGRASLSARPASSPASCIGCANQYLHRSHRSFTEVKIGMGPAKHNARTVIDDQRLVDKPSRQALNATNQGMQQAQEAVGGAIRRAGQLFSRQ